MESHHMAGTNIKQESLDANWFYGANSATEFIDSNHGNFSTDPFNPFPFNIVITMWYDNQSNTSGAYRGAWGHPMPWVFCLRYFARGIILVLGTFQACNMGPFVGIIDSVDSAKSFHSVHNLSTMPAMRAGFLVSGGLSRLS